MKIKTFLIAFLVIFMFAFPAFASEQIPEQLIYEGKQMIILHLHRPEISSDVNGITELAKDKLEEIWVKNRTYDSTQNDWNSIYSSGCVRNYVGYWEVKNSKLFLNKIIGMYVKDKEEPLFANWVTGTIESPIGKTINSDYYNPIYEKSFIIYVKNGAVIKTEIRNNKIE